jgi:formylmethanofuran dehydrogenase subunit E
MMKRYYIRVPRDYQFYISVDAEDSREARFEAIKSLVFKALHDFVPFDISAGDEVYPCDQCASFFPSSELKEFDGKQVCGQCEEYANGQVPEYW